MVRGAQTEVNEGMSQMRMEKSERERKRNETLCDIGDMSDLQLQNVQKCQEMDS